MSKISRTKLKITTIQYVCLEDHVGQVSTETVNIHTDLLFMLICCQKMVKLTLYTVHCGTINVSLRDRNAD